MLTNSIFTFKRWTDECPATLKTVRPILIQLRDHSKTLRKLLDNLIDLILECEKLLAASEKVNKVEELFLRQCYQLAAILADMPGITLDDLKTIKIRRRIMPSYLPNHLPKEKVDYISRQHYHGFKAATFNTLRRMGKAVKKGEFLTVKKSYFQEEGLAKDIQNMGPLIEKLPSTDDLDKFFLQLKEIIDEVNSSTETSGHRLIFLKRELETKLQAIKNNVEAMKAEYDEYNEIEKIYCAACVIDRTSKVLAEIIEKYLSSELTGLNEVIKAIKAVSGQINPMLMAYYHDYQQENPQVFGRLNRRLKVDYLDEEQREMYRLHIFNGKCYRFENKNGRFEIEPFSSTDYQSHSKDGWVSYIVNFQGEIFASTHSPKLLHSSFMSGGAVRYAGEMRIKDGKILEVSDYSGHYSPTLDNLEKFAQHLASRKVNIDKCYFSVVDDLLVSNKIDRIRQQGRYKGLTRKQISALEDKVWTESERLNYSTLYEFSNGKLVKALNYKKTLLLAAAVMATLLFAALFVGVIFASSGFAVPILAPLFIKAALVVGSQWALGISLTTSLSSIFLPPAIAVNVVGTKLIAESIKSVRRWVGGLFNAPVKVVTSSSQGMPEARKETENTTRTSHPKHKAILLAEKATKFQFNVGVREAIVRKEIKIQFDSDDDRSSTLSSR